MYYMKMYFIKFTVTLLKKQNKFMGQPICKATRLEFVFQLDIDLSKEK